MKIFSFLPREIRNPLEDELRTLGVTEDALFEIRLRAEGRCSILTRQGTKPLKIKTSWADINAITALLTGGALYAHRDTILDGYITPISGLRVGVCGRARYDNGRPVGVSEVRSLIFRISHGRCDFEDRLYEIWRAGVGTGMLIYSPPCGGKTTAIRRLAARIGREGMRVCVADERCEFLTEDYIDAEVDILRGYKKSHGIEIAVRTLGAELVIVDEIGAEEAGSVLSSLTLGVPIIATVHASNASEILHRKAFRPYIEAGVFETLVGIKKSGGAWRLEVLGASSLSGRSARGAAVVL